MPKFKVGEEIWIDTFKDIFVITKILNGLFYNLVDSDGHEYKGICEDELHPTAHTMLTDLGFEKQGKIYVDVIKRIIITINENGYQISQNVTSQAVCVNAPLHAALTQLMREQVK